MKINEFVDYQGAIYFFAAHCIALRSVRIPESPNPGILSPRTVNETPIRIASN